MDHDELLNKRVHAIAKAHKCAVDDVHQALDQHPFTLDRDAFLQRTLALELIRLDQLEMAFEDKALQDRDVAAGVLMCKIQERRATLLVLNAPIGHAVRVVSHPPEHRETSTDKVERALNALIEDQRRSQTN